MENKRFIGDVISSDDIKGWNDGDIVIIKGGTGTGKSTFIKEDLYEYAEKNDEKILMLVSRLSIIENFNKDIEGKSNIEIDTYQGLEQSIIHNPNGYGLKEYDYIVCDEFHYFLSDDFNKWLDVSFDAIMGQEKSVRIMMSATGDDVQRYFDEQGMETIDYSLPVNFDKINMLEFFYKDETLESYVQLAIKNNVKTMIFVDDASVAYELHKKYPKHTLFNCASGNRFYKHVKKKKVKEMYTKNKFDELILITTRVMDTGVNINDAELHNIVVDVISPHNIIQCIGRKRIMSDDDYINVFIRGRSKGSIRRFRDRVHKVREKLGVLDFNGDRSYVEKYYRDDVGSNLVYTEWDAENNEVVHKVNKLNYFKNQLDLEDLHAMEEYGYCRYISMVLGRAGDYVIREREIYKESLEMYLDSQIGEVMLQRKDREELIESINLRNGNNNTVVKDLDQLNLHLRKQNINFDIHQFSTSRNVDGKKKNYKAAWRVRKIVG